MTYKQPWKAALLNVFLPGSGHAYAQQWKKGILLYILLLFLILSIRFVAYYFFVLAGLVVLVPVFYLFIIISGYRAVDENKTYPKLKFDKWYFYILFFLSIGSAINFLVVQNIINNTPINFAKIPTPAMDPTLQVGDHLAFKKSQSPARDQVIVFKYPQDQTTLYIKRCIGLPGDTLSIYNRNVFINGNQLPPSSDFRYSYLITTDGTAINDNFFKELHILDYMTASGNSYAAYLTPNDVKKLNGFRFIKKVEPITLPEGVKDPSVYPNSADFGLNTDFYGPLYIPKKGDQMPLNKVNFKLYGKYIQAEDSSIQLNNGLLYQNGSILSEYKFKENYYFVMGDNRHNSLDSRYWGFVPEHLLVGEGLYFYWSKDFTRIGKSIN